MILKEKKQENYLGFNIIASKFEYQDINKNKIIKIYECKIYKENNFFINLGECNDGTKFTNINQCINQGKSFLNTLKQLKKF